MNHKFSNFVLNKIHKIKSLLKRTGEGGILIRYLRIKRFRNKEKKLMILSQVIAIWYFTILTTNYLTSDTGARFNDVEVIENQLHAKWDVGEEPPEDNDEWDKSSLDFDNSEAWAESCDIYTTIFNAGDKANTTSTWRYYVYKVVDGREVGEPVATGIVPTIQSGESGIIKSEVTEDGEYKFRVRRPLDHPAKNNPNEDGYTFIGWSEKVEVSGCAAQQEDDEINNPLPEEDITSPSEVINLSTNEANDIITLTWENPSDEDFSHNKVYRNNDTNPIEDNISNGIFQDSDIIAGTEYIYKITSVDLAGNESNGTTFTITTQSDIETVEPLSEVSDFKWIQNGESANVDISWVNPTDEEFSHTILYKNGEGVVDGNQSSYKDKGLTKKQDYIYKIVTVDNAGNESEGITITVNLE
ncbi:amyloid fiber anchoring/assembly protein TapA [Sutcliffiella deserti]|uniref:amyloid fiber anchoring/assembly protein TapA n=1 Tax=Sutcliffiella deserti TaxID=2875501 RepID=UPI001CBB8C2D|nr:amyloid fiber anchoring/assembly protein TapA [Sutcliffiella deserti]